MLMLSLRLQDLAIAVTEESPKIAAEGRETLGIDAVVLRTPAKPQIRYVFTALAFFRMILKLLDTAGRNSKVYL